MRVVFAVLSVLFFSAPVFSEEPKPVHLMTQIWPPYHYYEPVNGKLVGQSIEVVECVFEKLAIPYEITVLPWKRAERMVKVGGADGFFSASQSDERDQFAQRSVDIAPQNWVWYTLVDSEMYPEREDFKEKAKVAGALGSNILSWLYAENYQVTAEVKTTESLIKMLKLHRIDAFMGNDLVVDQMLDEYIDEGEVVTHSAISMPLGVYFSHQFLESRPDFLEQFNQFAQECR
ncbi:transporter substrate-binding domain-containing protein [Vibrio sp. Of7-15]|uniref:substrate-binding periplasmic protein n=1 Tax=Vibrio sp. Of7-15 TaxID=2724879 RepID=UPI001EF26BF3|nr:transporter substrate-binding domain-containing protein [Vibrio sp. Of7-15]MCG7497282.1 transporter substrate-binding domain-containing protein [Vibrio sp. Of7-15]